MNAVLPAKDARGAILLVIAAITFLAYALEESNGLWHDDGIRWLAAAFVLVVVAVVAQLGPAWRFTLFGEPPELLLLAAGLASAFYNLIKVRLTIDMPGLVDPFQYELIEMGIASAAILSGIGLAHKPAFEKLWFPLLVFTHLVMGAALFKLSPIPHIDTFSVENEAAAALLEGKDPFAITLRDIYEGLSPYFAPGASIGGRLQFGFPYPPLCLLMVLPGYVLGHDPRWSMLVAMNLAALFMGYARPGRLPKLAAALFLFTPRTFFVLDQAWTDPFIVVLIAFAAFCALRKRGWLFVALGLLFCLKQQMFIGVPAAMMLFPRRPTTSGLRGLFGVEWREAFVTMVKAFGVAMLVTLPFVLWDVKAFLHTVVHSYEMYRMDSLSFIVYYARKGTVYSLWTGLKLMPFAALVAFLRVPRTPSGFALGSAFTHFTLYAFSTHGFCNEYYTVLGCLSVAVATAALADAPGRR